MCFCESLNSVGAAGCRGSASFLPSNSWRAKGTRGSGRSQGGCQALLEGPPSPVRPAGRRPSGASEAPPTSLHSAAQRLLCPEQSCALGSQPDGFRNRVAAVSALGQPHLCRSALGSPAAPRSESGNPHWLAPSGSPPSAAAGRLNAGAEQVRLWGLSLRRCAPPTQPGGDAPDAGGGGAGSPRLSRCWVGGKRGCAG